MKNVFLFLLLLTLQIYGQERKESVVQKDSTTNAEVVIKVSSLTELENAKLLAEERLKSANIKLLKQDSILNVNSAMIKNMKMQISSLRADTLACNNAIRGLKKQLLKSDTCLINVASNFIYIPYEAYSVKEIAIPAYEMIFDESLRNKYKTRYALLIKYKDDVIDLLNFLEEQEKELNKPFTKNANDAISVLHTKRFYISYHAFDDWESTFLGGKIAEVEKQLKEFNGTTHKAHFGKIISELQECLKTENNL